MSESTETPGAAVPAAPTLTAAGAGRRVIHRHRVTTRIWHWVNLVALTILLMSGLNIFNAHPRLYWGQFGADSDRPFLELGAQGSEDDPRGFAEILGHRIGTTGILGVSAGPDGDPLIQGFPSWSTLPSWRDLATARRWHFFFAWIFVANLAAYLAAGLLNGHFRRDIAPRRDELRPRTLAHHVVDHLRLRFPRGEAARHYNVLQKLAYLGVIFVALPLMVLTGLTMSPGIDAAAPWLLDLFGGRQSARTLHFLVAGSILFFVVIHLAALLAVGVWNELRSMITGRYVIKEDRPT